MTAFFPEIAIIQGLVQPKDKQIISKIFVKTSV